MLFIHCPRSMKISSFVSILCPKGPASLGPAVSNLSLTFHFLLLDLPLCHSSLSSGHPPLPLSLHPWPSPLPSPSSPQFLCPHKKSNRPVWEFLYSPGTSSPAPFFSLTAFKKWEQKASRPSKGLGIQEQHCEGSVWKWPQGAVSPDLWLHRCGNRRPERGRDWLKVTQS